eukprot:scaffold588_cov247-Pinguiococcus_pyrenoidosus.AAC.10
MSALEDALLCCLEDRFAAALPHFEAHFTTEGPSARALSARSRAHFECGDYVKAMADAVEAEKLGGAADEALMFRKAKAAFYLDEFRTALRAFTAGHELWTSMAESERPKGRKYELWLRKCQAEIEDEEAEAEAEAEFEVEAEVEAQVEAQVETEVDDDVENAAPLAAQPTAAAAPAVLQKPVVSLPPPLTYSFYQSTQWMTIEISARGLREEQVQVEMEQRKLKVVIQRDGQEPETVVDAPLFADINVEKSKTRIKPTKVE